MSLNREKSAAPFRLGQIAMISITIFTNSMLRKQLLPCLQDMESQCLTQCETLLSSKQPLHLMK